MFIHFSENYGLELFFSPNVSLTRQRLSYSLSSETFISFIGSHSFSFTDRKADQ